MRGKSHVDQNYNFKKFTLSWQEILKNVHKKYGSWDTRKGYKSWEITEV